MQNKQQQYFKSHSQATGLLEDLTQGAFPAKMYAWNASTLQLNAPESSFFGFVHRGRVQLTTAHGHFNLHEGMYFCVPQQLKIVGEGSGLLIEQQQFDGFLHIGGPIESQGRLRYIDGCTDSLLIAPPVMGDPCFNLLNIPAHTFQTQHTHPSFRIGMIVRGRGTCITPQGNSPLYPGMLFMIPENALHSFKTEEEDLLIVAYHPDSDFGPTHEDHPMINRTYINN